MLLNTFLKCLISGIVFLILETPFEYLNFLNFLLKFFILSFIPLFNYFLYKLFKTILRSFPDNFSIRGICGAASIVCFYFLFAGDHMTLSLHMPSHLFIACWTLGHLQRLQMVFSPTNDLPFLLLDREEVGRQSSH